MAFEAATAAAAVSAHSPRVPVAPAEPFALNPQAQVHIETLSSGCPVMVVDDFYADPLAVRALGLAGRYDSSLAYYPGLHSSITREHQGPLHLALSNLLAVLGSLQCRPADISSDFSIVTTPAREMLAKQKHPHVDGVPLAGVVYLNPDFEIGTSFFRHRPTGQAFVRSLAEQQAYSAWMDAFGDQQQPATYAIAQDDGGGAWEHLHSVAGRFNRLVMYPGTAFHSIAMRDVVHNLSLDSARLTQRFFVNRAGTV
jgi:hypothetical protein